MSIMNGIKSLVGVEPVATIRKKVGDIITVFVQAEGLPMHSAGCDVVHPPIVSFTGYNPGTFDRTVCNNYPADRRVYAAGENDNAEVNAGVIAGLLFTALTPGEGNFYRIQNEKAIRRNADGTFTKHATSVQDAALSVDAEQPPAQGAVMFRLIIE